MFCDVLQVGVKNIRRSAALNDNQTFIQVSHDSDVTLLLMSSIYRNCMYINVVVVVKHFVCVCVCVCIFSNI